jgi:hypothetical protein
VVIQCMENYKKQQFIVADTEVPRFSNFVADVQLLMTFFISVASFSAVWSSKSLSTRSSSPLRGREPLTVMDASSLISSMMPLFSRLDTARIGRDVYPIRGRISLILRITPMSMI